MIPVPTHVEHGDSRPGSGSRQRRVSKSDVITALYDITVQEEYYQAHLAEHVSEVYWYEDYIQNDAAFREILSDNNVSQTHIQSFNSGLNRQRGSADIGEIEALRAYICSDKI